MLPTPPDINVLHFLDLLRQNRRLMPSHCAGNRGSCIYVGGKLHHDEDDGLLRYQSGRSDRHTITSDGTRKWMFFHNTKVRSKRSSSSVHCLVHSH
jgi:hypothetical protein